VATGNFLSITNLTVSFDGFKAVKFMNYLHQNDYLTKIPVTEAVEAVYKKNYSPSEYLDYLRTYDKMKTMCLTSELTINEN
jgi:glycerol-3-phosphate dehydrogenase